MASQGRDQNDPISPGGESSSPIATPIVERRRRPRRTIGTAVGARNHSPYPAIAARLYHEAELLFGHKHYPESEAKVIQLLHLQERVIGRRHPEYALALSMLGEIRLIRCDFAAAERMLREALDIRRETQGEAHPDYANVLGCLSRLYWRRGPREQAEPYLDRALRIRLDALGPRHPETVRNRRELAGLRRRLGNWEGAGDLDPPAGEPKDWQQSPGASAGRELAHSVVVLANALKSLGERLSLAATDVAEAGIPIGDESIGEVFSRHRDFILLREKARQVAESRRIPSPAPESLPTLLEIATLVDEIVERERRWEECEEGRRRALEILDQVLALDHVDGHEFAPLIEVKGWAGDLRESIAQAPWDQLPAQTPTLSSGEHAFVHLLALVNDLQGLSDRRWADCFESVRETFSQAMARAAAQGRLVERPERRGSSAAQTLPPTPPWASLSGGTPASTAEGGPSATPTIVGVCLEGGGASQQVSGNPPEAAPVPTVAPLASDLVMPSLVEVMGRTVTLPTDSVAEPKPERIDPENEGEPEIVLAPPKPRFAENARLLKERRGAGEHPILRRIGPGVVAGPLPLVQTSPTDGPEPPKSIRNVVPPKVRKPKETPPTTARSVTRTRVKVDFGMQDAEMPHLD